MRQLRYVFSALALLFLVGCGHNTSMFFSGWYVKGGFDPQNYVPTIAVADGIQITDISRENSSWEVEIDEGVGLSVNKDGTIKGIKALRRSVGPQMNGYLVDLANTNPELAEKYVEAMKAYWEAQK